MRLLNPLPVLTLQAIGFGLDIQYYSSATKRHIELSITLAVWSWSATWEF